MTTVHDTVTILDHEKVSEIMESAKMLFVNNNWEKIIELNERYFHFFLNHHYTSEAKELIDLAIESAYEVDNKELQARFSHDKADILAREGRYREVEPLYQYSFQTYENLGRHDMATHSLHMLSLAKRALGDIHTAEKYSRECLDRAVRHQMGPWVAHPLHLLSWIERDRGNYQKALDYLLQALKIHESIITHDQSAMLLQTYHDLARLYILTNNYSEARKYITEADNYEKMIPHEEISITRERILGDLELAIGNLQESLMHYLQAQDLAARRSDQRTVANINLNIGHIYLRKVRLRKAFYYYQWGLFLLHRLGLINMNRVRAVINQVIRKKPPFATIL